MCISPLPGGSLLYHIDAEFNATEDIKMRDIRMTISCLQEHGGDYGRGLALLNEFLDRGGFKQYPDKTYIGKISHGMDWLGHGLMNTGPPRG